MRRASLATARAFRAILEDGRERVRQIDQDPIGDVLGEGISKKKLDRLMADGDPAAAGVVLGAVEAFAQEFATVIQRIMRLKEWCGTQRIVVGGGLRASRVAERAIGRTAALLKAAQHDVELGVRHRTGRIARFVARTRNEVTLLPPGPDRWSCRAAA